MVAIVNGKEIKFNCSHHKWISSDPCPECKKDAVRLEHLDEAWERAMRKAETKQVAQHEANVVANRLEKAVRNYEADKAAKAQAAAKERAIAQHSMACYQALKAKGFTTEVLQVPYDPSRAPPIDVYGDSAELLPDKAPLSSAPVVEANEKVTKVTKAGVFDDLFPGKEQAPDSLFGGPQRKNSGVVDWPRS